MEGCHPFLCHASLGAAFVMGQLCVQDEALGASQEPQASPIAFQTPDEGSVPRPSSVATAADASNAGAAPTVLPTALANIMQDSAGKAVSVGALLLFVCGWFEGIMWACSLQPFDILPMVAIEPFQQEDFDVYHLC